MAYDDETARHLRWYFAEPDAPTQRYAIPPARRATDAELSRIGSLRAELDNARFALVIERNDPRTPAARAMAAGEALLDATEAYADAVLALTQPRN